MDKAKIKEYNSQEFLDDVKRVSECMVITPASKAYLKVNKRDVLKEAETRQIKYYLSDKIYHVRREVMIII